MPVTFSADEVAPPKKTFSPDEVAPPTTSFSPDEVKPPQQSLPVAGLGKQIYSSLPTINSVVEAFKNPKPWPGIRPYQPMEIKSDDSIPATVGKEAYNLAIGIPNFIATPAGTLTTVTGGVGGTVARGIGVLFSAQAFHQAGEALLSLIPNWSKLSTPEKTKAIVDVGGNTIFGGLMAKAAAPTAGEVLAPKTTEAVKATIATPVPEKPTPTPEKATPEIKAPQIEPQAQNEAISEPLKPTDHVDYTPEDLAKYQELKAKSIPQSMEEFSSPEFQKNWHEFEALRNKYNGNPPRQIVEPSPAQPVISEKPPEVKPAQPLVAAKVGEGTSGFKAPPMPEKFDTLDDALKYRQAYKDAEIEFYKSLGLTDSEAAKFFRAGDNRSNVDVSNLEDKLTSEQRERLDAFSTGEGQPVYQWDRQYNPENLAGETNRKTLADHVVSNLSRESAPTDFGDKLLHAAVALRQLKENGGTWSDVARALDSYTTKISGSQGDKAFAFKKYGEEIRKFSTQQGIDLPQGEFGAKIGAVTPLKQISTPPPPAVTTGKAIEKPDYTNWDSKQQVKGVWGGSHRLLARQQRAFDDAGIPWANRGSHTLGSKRQTVLIPNTPEARELLKKVGGSVTRDQWPHLTDDKASYSQPTPQQGDKPNLVPTLKNPLKAFGKLFYKNLEGEWRRKGSTAKVNQSTIDALEQLIKTKPATAEFEQADIAIPSETGLPTGVASKGKEFAPELMEATRRLGSLARYKELLGNIRGKFVKSKERDRIETEDITNQKTIAHELGHAIESILFPREEGTKYVPLGKKFAGKEKQFRTELTATSELMRGKIQGKPHQIAYRRRGEELFADYVSLYVHDPVKAKELAPNFTQAFEKTIAGNKEVSDILNQLHEGKVEPVAPAREIKPTGEASEMPGRMPARPKMAESLYDRKIAASAQDIVADSVRMSEAETQAALIKSTRWQKNVPKVSDRNDVGAFIEGIGNLEKPGDTIEGVKSRMTEPMKQLAKDIRFQTELTRQNINKTLRNYGQTEYLKFLEDYLSHFYIGKQRAISSALNNWIKNSPNAKQRKVPTLREAVELGLKPVTQDPTVTYPIYASMNWRVAASKKMLFEARNLKGQDGEPAIMPASKAPLDWPVSNHPLIQQVYAHATPGGTMLWRGGAAIHPDLFPALQQILEKPTSSSVGKVYDSVNAFSRIGVFAGSLFHDLTMRLASVGAMAQVKNPIRGLVMIGERDPITGERKLIQSTRTAGKRVLESEDTVRDAVRSGLKLSDKTSDQYEIGSQKSVDKVIDKVNQIPVLGKATRMIQNAYEWRQKGLWRNTHDAYKIMAYQDVVRRGVDKEIAASYMNDAFGGQEKQLMFWADPRSQKFLGRILLAPDWTISTLRSIPGMSDAASWMRSKVNRGAAPRYVGMQGNLLRTKFWATELAALATGAIFTQYAIYQTFGSKDKGDNAFPWENETGQKFSLDITPLMRALPGHSQDDLTRHYVNPGKRAAEIFRWFYDPIQAATYKLAPPLQEGIKQVSGVTPSSYKGVYPAEWVKDAKASWASVPERLESVAKMFEPFSLQGNQVALSLPMHKGKTAVEQVYGMVNRWADQSDDPKIKSTYGTKAYFADTPSTYSNLKKLIATGDYDKASTEYQRLKDEGHPKENIEKSFNPEIKFTGKNEENFKFSLSPDELETYEAAIEYRKILQARLKILEY